ncbi:MAG: ABC-2 transporter permease [Syntrophomonas sp.]
MYNLVRKDFLIQINYILTTIPFSIFFVLIFPKAFPGLGYAMGASAIVYMLAISTSFIDARNHTDIILNSLPVLRSQIILSKYLATFLFTLIGLLIMVLAGLAVNISPLPFNIPFITWQEITITFIMCTVLAAIYFPICYKLSHGKALTFVYVILFQVAIFSPGGISDYVARHINEPWIQQLLSFNLNTPWGLPLIGASAAILLVILSYLLTVKIYMVKDL